MATHYVSSKPILQFARKRSSHGGVLSPTLFLLFSSDLVSKLPKGIKTALDSDDLVMWCMEEYATTATYRMPLAVDKLNSWTEKWCVAINKNKSSTTLFTLSQKQKAGTPLKEDESATYQQMSKRASVQRRMAEENSIATMSASVKRRLSSERSRCLGHRSLTITCLPGSSKSFW